MEIVAGLKMARVGIILGSLTVPRYVSNAIATLIDDKSITPILLKLDNSSTHQKNTFLKILEKTELRILTLAKKSFRERACSIPVDLRRFSEVINLNDWSVSQEGQWQPSQFDKARIQALGLDLIVCFLPGLHFAGDTASTTRKGILAVVHGDANGFEAFRAVHERKPSHSYTVLLSTPEASAPKVIHKGEIITKRSYIENCITLGEESIPFLTLVARDLLVNEASYENCSPFLQNFSTVQPPTIRDGLSYVARTIGLHAKMGVNRGILAKRQRWQVGYYQGHWKDFAFSSAKTIPNPKHRFFADPFVMKRDSRYYIFLEDYDDRIGRGRLAAVEVEADGSLQVFEDILPCPYHLSFPFIFEEDGETWMIPEISQSSAVQLYRSVEFPNKWEMHKVLMNGVSAADTMLIKKPEGWYMLTNLSPFNTPDHLSQLHVFYADSYLSTDWKPVSTLPVVNNPRNGRNAGILIAHEGNHYRVRQRQAFGQYGAGFSVAKIIRLDKEGYAEETFREVLASEMQGAIGMHHMHGVDDFTVFDFAKTERYD
jgi:hypothetical protein